MELCAAVEALLQQHYVSSILDAPARESLVPHGTTPVTEDPGMVIGRYKLLEKIGEEPVVGTELARLIGRKKPPRVGGRTERGNAGLVTQSGCFPSEPPARIAQADDAEQGRIGGLTSNSQHYSDDCPYQERSHLASHGILLLWPLPLYRLNTKT